MKDLEFETFVAARRGVLLRTAVMLGCPRAEAEDAVQTALLRCYRAWSKVARADSPDAYVHRVLTNVLHDRRERRWNDEVPTADLPQAPTADRDPTLGLAVRRALLTISLEHREVLVLRYYADLSERDTATALGLALGTVKSRTARALTALAAADELEDLTR